MTDGTRAAREKAMPAQLLTGRARTSLRQLLWGLVFALAFPSVLVAAAGLYSSYRAEQQITDQRLRDTTRALTLSLEREIQKVETALRVLSLSPSLRTGDLEAFYEQAKDVGLANPSWIGLFEPDGTALLNTRLPYGAKLPDSQRSETLKRVYETRKPELSNLYVGANTGRYLVSLDWPVIIGDRVAYILSIAIGPDVFQHIIGEQRIVEGWNAAVLDRSGRIVARARSPEQFVGQFARPGLLEAIAAAPEGYAESMTLEGIPVRTYFARSQLYGWSFVIGLPNAELAAAFQRSLFWLLVMGGVILLGFGLVFLLSRAIARPVDQLVAAATTLGRGELVAAVTTHVEEFDAIQTAMADAAKAIRQQEKEREDALERIAESEARLRLALEVGHLGAWEYTPSTGAYVSSATCRMNYGRRPDEPFTYEDLLASIHPDDRQKRADVFAKAIAQRTDLHAEYRVIWPDRSEHWLRVRGRTRVGPDGELTMVGFSQEITERRLAEERQALLLHELNHRVKNTLATVQSVAFLTRRSAEAGDPKAWDAFLDRLQGLAMTHELLTSSQWKGAALEDVLRKELDPYQDPSRQRIRLRGPTINLQPSAVLALGLAVHELATNATKYGSLSVDEGRVSVTWAVTAGASSPSLLLEWQESGGPLVAPPKRQGFGTKLIQRGLAQQLGGEIKLDFLPAGIRCIITFPLHAVAQPLDDVGAARKERYAS